MGLFTYVSCGSGKFVLARPRIGKSFSFASDVRLFEMLAASRGTLLSSTGTEVCILSLDTDVWEVRVGHRLLKRKAVLDAAAPAHVFGSPPSESGEPLSTPLELLLFLPALALEERDGVFWPMEEAATKALFFRDDAPTKPRKPELVILQKEEVVDCATSSSAPSENSDEEITEDECESECDSE